jgi:hypothetical protein
MKRRIPHLLWLLLVACAGCGQEMTGVAVEGTVTRDGQLLQEGYVLFKPSTGGTEARAKIKEGRYHIPATDGLQPGRYIVVVSLPGPSSRYEVQKNLSKRSPQRDRPLEWEREIAGTKAQIDLEM